MFYRCQEGPVPLHPGWAWISEYRCQPRHNECRPGSVVGGHRYYRVEAIALRVEVVATIGGHGYQVHFWFKV